MKVIKYKK